MPPPPHTLLTPTRGTIYYHPYYQVRGGVSLKTRRAFLFSLRSFSPVVRRTHRKTRWSGDHDKRGSEGMPPLVCLTLSYVSRLNGSLLLSVPSQLHFLSRGRHAQTQQSQRSGAGRPPSKNKEPLTLRGWGAGGGWVHFVAEVDG